MKTICCLVTFFVFSFTLVKSQTTLKLSSNYYTDYYKNKTIAQQGSATYLITFNNQLKITRVQGPNGLDVSMTIDNFWKEGNPDSEDYELNWTVEDDYYVGFLLKCKKDNNSKNGLEFSLYQFYKDGKLRVYTDLSILK